MICYESETTARKFSFPKFTDPRLVSLVQVLYIDTKTRYIMSLDGLWVIKGEYGSILMIFKTVL